MMLVNGQPAIASARVVRSAQAVRYGFAFPGWLSLILRWAWWYTSLIYVCLNPKNALFDCNLGKRFNVEFLKTLFRYVTVDPPAQTSTSLSPHKSSPLNTKLQMLHFIFTHIYKHMYVSLQLTFKVGHPQCWLLKFKNPPSISNRLLIGGGRFSCPKGCF